MAPLYTAPNQSRPDLFPGNRHTISVSGGQRAYMRLCGTARSRPTGVAVMGPPLSVRVAAVEACVLTGTSFGGLKEKRLVPSDPCG